MTFKEKREQLKLIYRCFEESAYAYKKDAICKIGCTYCCMHAGSIDIITLEGLIIRESINTFPKVIKTRIKKKLSSNRRDKENRKIAPCPFLKADNTCMIYEIRPFSCRRLYSTQECRGRGPTVHRQVMKLAGETVKDMQRLDHTGYSGHISFILYLLDKPAFRKLYLSGGYDPLKIREYGKTHGISINRVVSPPSVPLPT